MNKKILKYILAALALALIIVILWYFKSIVVYLIIASLISLIGHPVVKLMDGVKIKNFKLPRAFNAAIALILLWTIIVIAVRIFIPVIGSEAKELSSIDVKTVITSLEEPLNNMEGFFEKMHIKNDEGDDFKTYISKKIVSVLNVSYLSKIFSTIVGALGDIFVAIFSISFISFFFLKDDKLFSNGILLFSPEKHEESIRNVLISIKKLLMRYFIGIGFQIILIMTLITIGLTIVGIDFQRAIVIGLFAGLINVVPYIGPIIGALFGIVIGIASNLDVDFYSEMLPMIGYMGIVFISVQIIDNILFQPIIFSSSVKAHPLEIFLVIMMAASLAGIAGMVLAIPAYTILRVIAKEFFNNFRVVKKITEKI